MYLLMSPWIRADHAVTFPPSQVPALILPDGIGPNSLLAEGIRVYEHVQEYGPDTPPLATRHATPDTQS